MEEQERAKRKVTVWTEEEIRQLKKLYADMTTAEVAVKLKRSTRSIMQKAHYMGLMKFKQKMWSEAEINQLKELFPAKGTREVAKELSRSKKSVIEKAFKLGIKKSQEYLKSIGQA